MHAWLVTREERFRPGSSFFHRNIEQGFFSLLFLVLGVAPLLAPLLGKLFW